ncbi:GGDEF domain-containing protein [Pseudomaricurvus alkylphenolicus]|uniref:GGDEF domain-containing protein n=1 Tax=Pseudomaricurvus alkylphenolicus TaxID=1306991 RepID=UPI0014222BC5|nr:diguanylate cyclase [Pseudomaricurvus alkylphenolicus]NIB39097.1 GGDEF domain-containing protein [Pseudomaricurvus alkylphenolicus]
MKFLEGSQDSAQILRKAIPMMVERDIPPTPQNYSLWYAHAGNKHPELSKRLLEQFPEKGSYNGDKSEALFFDYFIKQHLPRSEKAQNALASLLSQLFGAVNQIEDGTRDYGDALQSSLAQLDGTSDQQEIQAILSQILEDTSAVQSASQAFQGELETAKAEIEELKEKLKVSREDALVDSLTKIGNRRAFDQAMSQALTQTDTPTCLLLLDLDHFKNINDTYGHVMGDLVLERMGRILKAQQRPGVQPMRYGGEEFAIIFTGQQQDAAELADTVRKQVANTISIKQNDTGKQMGAVTVSIGIAQAGVAEDPGALKERADQALYQAKENGRNRVECAGG